MWVFGIAAVIGVLWIIGQSEKSPTSPAPAYSPPVETATPSYSPPPAQPQAPSLVQESKPPVGQDLVFSTAQIRYCLAEDIRMEGAKAALNNYSDSDVDRFNAMVADYNSRCSSFRYRSGMLESARRDVEPYRSQLQAEGRSVFDRRPSRGSLSAPAPAHPAADETVRAVQQRLNELGYNAGPTDGLMGRGTRAAIDAFQQDHGLTGTGTPDQALLAQLQQATSLRIPDPVASTATSESFGKYATPVYSGPISNPDFNSLQGSRTYRTRIREGMKKGVNFAGHFAVITIGCGTGCNFSFVADLKTGALETFPLGGEEYQGLSLDYRADSRLVRADWYGTADWTNGPVYCEEYLLSNNKFIRIADRKMNECTR